MTGVFFYIFILFHHRWHDISTTLFSVFNAPHCTPLATTVDAIV